jgi:hypothetical protein
MMGIKERNFRPLPVDLSLEALVPKDSFYRRLEERIDLSFVRELVLPLYANGGRHSIDPVVFFKLQLVLFFEDLRSERRLTEVVADRLSLRWYLGYDLDERLPDHSSLTKHALSLRFNHEEFCDGYKARRKTLSVPVFADSSGLLEGRVAFGSPREPAFRPSGRSTAGFRRLRRRTEVRQKRRNDAVDPHRC